MINKELITKARQANLAEYLLSIGVPLIQKGNRYRHKEHDSLTFTENAYYWNSHQDHGNAIDYLVKYMDMDFKTAVSVLANASPAPMGATANELRAETFEFDHMTLCQDTYQIKQYLNKTRFIDYGVINYLIENKLLVQEERTNNAIFLMYDENNVCVGAELQGIIKKRFKGVKSNSKYGYGFNVRFTDNDTFDYALFFESAIDLISFIDYKNNREKKDLTRCILISMAGLKPNILKHSLKAFKGNPKAVLCVDNDTAGTAFKLEIENMKIPFIDRLPDEKFKDWNEQLKGTKRENKPIERLIRQYER